MLNIFEYEMRMYILFELINFVDLIVFNLRRIGLLFFLMIWIDLVCLNMIMFDIV